MTAYRVIYERDEAGWWIARVARVPGCVTQGRTVAEARRRIREALDLFMRNASRVPLLDDVRLPASARRALGQLERAERRLEQAAMAAARGRVAAAQALTGPPLRLSVRDAAEVLGLSHQRVQQLKGASRTRRRRPARARQAATSREDAIVT